MFLLSSSLLIVYFFTSFLSSIFIFLLLFSPSNCLLLVFLSLSIVNLKFWYFTFFMLSTFFFLSNSICLTLECRKLSSLIILSSEVIDFEHKCSSMTKRWKDKQGKNKTEIDKRTLVSVRSDENPERLIPYKWVNKTHLLIPTFLQ